MFTGRGNQQPNNPSNPFGQSSNNPNSNINPQQQQQTNPTTGQGIFGQSTTPFGATSSTSSPFATGQSSNSPFGKIGFGGFGGTTGSPSSNNPFGNLSNTTNPTTNQQSGLSTGTLGPFGQSSTINPISNPTFTGTSNTNLFGQSINTASNSTLPNRTVSSSTQGGSGLFGSNVTNTSSFGTGLTNSGQSLSSPNTFGSNQVQNQPSTGTTVPTIGGLFGNSSSIGSNPSSTPLALGGGQSIQSQSSLPLTSTSTNAFGQQSTLPLSAPQAFSFGTTNTATATAPLNPQTNSFPLGTGGMGSSGLGTGTATAGGLFGQQQSLATTTQPMGSFTSSFNPSGNASFGNQTIGSAIPQSNNTPIAAIPTFNSNSNLNPMNPPSSSFSFAAPTFGNVNNPSGSNNSGVPLLGTGGMGMTNPTTNSTIPSQSQSSQFPQSQFPLNVSNQMSSLSNVGASGGSAMGMSSSNKPFPSVSAIQSQNPSNPSNPSSISMPFASSIEIPSNLKNKTLGDIVTDWQVELENQVTEFHKQANELRKYDSKLHSSAEKLITLNDRIIKLEAVQSELDQNLNYIIAQQDELENLLDGVKSKLETKISNQKELHGDGSVGSTIPISAFSYSNNPNAPLNSNKMLLGTGAPVTQSDLERQKLYDSAIKIHSDIDTITTDLNKLINKINTNVESEREHVQTHGNNNEKSISNIVRIMNAHMDAIQWMQIECQELEGKFGIVKEEKELTLLEKNRLKL